MSRPWLHRASPLLILALALSCLVGAPLVSLPDQAANEFFAHPWKTFAQDNVPRDFRIVVLSHLAEYCVNLTVCGDRTPQQISLFLDSLCAMALSGRVGGCARSG